MNNALFRICLFLKWATAMVSGSLVALIAVHFGRNACFLAAGATLSGLLGGACCVLKAAIHVYGDPEWIKSLREE